MGSTNQNNAHIHRCTNRNNLINKNSGKLKQMKVKTEKNSAKEEQPDWNNAADNKAGAVDQIKKKYGFSSAGVSINWLPTISYVPNYA